MMTIQLANPVAALTEKIAQPFDEAAPTVRKLANLYNASNTQLRTHQQTLSVSFKGLGADSFVTMINKQINWVDTITGHLNDLAGLYETCANDVRAAARAIEYAVEPFLDVAQWVVDRLTPDIVVKHGEDAVHAVFDDMRAQLQREMNDAGGFFSNLVHAHFGAALHDVVDGVKGLAHLGGDVLAMVAAVEPILCQWAANIYQAVNWLLNKLNSWLLAAADWLLGLSNIADDTVVFTDPNSTDAEKWMAGIDMGLNIAMDVALFIPGADLFSLAGKGVLKLLEKFGLKEILDMIVAKAVTRITETMAAQVVKGMIEKFEQKIAQKFSEIVIDRMLKRDLSKTIFAGLADQLKQRLFPEVQAIIDDYLAGKITKEEAQARLDELLKDALPIHGGGKAGFDEFSWSKEFPGLDEKQLAQRVEQIRQALLNTNDINRVRQSLLDAGINVSDDTIRAIKNYNFNSRGLAFTFDNYAAWRRLATGKATVGDIRYLVHEMAEVDGLRKIQQQTGFDFMGRGWDQMTRLQRQEWLAKFDVYYLQAHSDALLSEYKFLSKSLSDITNGHVNLSPVVMAAIDPASNEARRYMYIDGLPLFENRNLAAWQSQGNQIVTLSGSVVKRLGLSTNRISIKDLIQLLRGLPASSL